MFQCSYYQCATSYDTAISEAEDFIDESGTAGDTYTCYYDPDHTNVIFLSRTSTSVIIHTIVWPFLVLIAGIVVLIYGCVSDPDTNCGKKCKGQCSIGKSSSQTEVQDVESLHEVRDMAKYQFENASLQIEDRPQTAVTIGGSQFNIKRDLLQVPGQNDSDA